MARIKFNVQGTMSFEITNNNSCLTTDDITTLLNTGELYISIDNQCIFNENGEVIADVSFYNNLEYQDFEKISN
jgi:hypothetical protein